MPLKPRDDVVMVKQDEIEKEGLIIVSKRKLFQGIVVKAGPGKRLDNGRTRPMCVKEGDRVIFGEWSGQKAELKGEEYLIILEDDIIGILEDD